MKLEHIKEENCPICGCQIIINEEVELDRISDKLKIRRHCNGQQWEHRTFACGQRISWIPNFSNSELSQTYTCKRNPEYIEKKEKREKAKDRVISYIQNLDNVDVDFKTRMEHEIKTVWI